MVLISDFASYIFEEPNHCCCAEIMSAINLEVKEKVDLVVSKWIKDTGILPFRYLAFMLLVLSM